MSQSLLLQGCFRTAGLGDVSRPGGLNPFYFRAAFGLIVAWPSGRALVSIPFTSGLLSDRALTQSRPPPVGLNPFYFRAAFGRDERSHCRRSSGLNPFYFRAAFGLMTRTDILAQHRSHSLLLQGCFRTNDPDRHPSPTQVSIPFTSGLLSDIRRRMIKNAPVWSQSLLLQGCFRTPAPEKVSVP